MKDQDLLKRKDRRPNRTKQAVRQHLIKLIQEKHYDLITVQDLIDGANIGRSTFYTHFRDKEDVLFSDWKRFLGFFFGYMNWENLDRDRFLPITELFHHLKEYYNFYKALERSQKSERLFRTGYVHLVEKLEDELYKRYEKDAINIPIPILASYLAREIFGHMRWWLDSGMPHSPEEMDRSFHALTMPGAKAALVGTRPASSPIR